MSTSTEYDWIIVILSLLCFVLSIAHASWSSTEYRMHHDDRAAVTLAKAIALTVVSLGILISATGLVFEESVLSVAGLAIARGALIVILLTLVITDWHRGTPR